MTVVDREPIDDLADEFLERFRRGERPALTEYISAHPQFADEIRELFPTLVMLESLGPRPEDVAKERASGGAIAGLPQQLGEYRILREVGRGGMGVVYEAEQVSLGRHVALKVLPAHAVLTPSLLTRFQNEARVAARLHHTNIVPVFGVGEDQAIHYYAMQFIQGHGLDEVLEELRRLGGADLPEAFDAASSRANVDSSAPSDGQLQASGQRTFLLGQRQAGEASSSSIAHGNYLRSVARVGLQVAEALAYAHGQGVLHRDIKPSNLLLDAQGCVWITDFGLAKLEGSELTRTGDVVGTLRYLAPERFRGTSDARTDIYGLGVTLFELLTTRPAFTATDRARLVHDILHVDPAPPRRLARRIPRDLETIVLKAMTKEPGQRYASAADMAADLRRFLEDQPIAARRIGIVERMWRWCTRRPALASVSAALLLSLVLGLGGASWQWQRAEANLKEAVRQRGLSESAAVRAQRNLHEADHQRTIAQQEAERAEANYQTARGSVNELLTLVSEDDLRDQPGLQPLRLRLLTKAIEFHEKILAERQHDLAPRRDLALGYYRVGQLKRDMGPAGEAAEAYQRAIALLESAEASGKGDRETAILLVYCYNVLAVEHVKQGNEAAARAMLDLARNGIDRVLAEEPSDASAELASAMTFNNLAWLVSRSKELDSRSRNEAALQLHEQALAIFRRVAEREPMDWALQYNISWALSNMARRQMPLGRHEEARRLLEECLAIRLELSRRRPASLAMQNYVAATHNALGDVVLSSRDRSSENVARAAADYERALAIQERLTRENPAMLFYWREYAGTLENLSRLYRQSGDLQRALAWRRRANEALKTCLDLEPTNVASRARWATQLDGQATMASELGLHAQALATRLRVREAWRPIQQDASALPSYRATIHLHLASLMFELGMQDRPAELYGIACEREELTDGSPSALFASSSALQKATRAATRAVTQSDESLAATARCQQMAVALFREAALADPFKTAALARRQLHMRSYGLLLPLDADLTHTPDDQKVLARRSIILRQLGDLSGANADRQRALQLLDAVLQNTPKSRFALYQRAKLHLDVGDWELAISDCGRVLAILPNHVSTLECRARASAGLGRWQQAKDDLTRVLELRPDLIGNWPRHCRAAYELGHEDEARANAARLVELAGDDIQKMAALLWTLLMERQVDRFPEAAIALGKRANELGTSTTHTALLGGVYMQLRRYHDAAEALRQSQVRSPGETEAFAGFWLAISYHHLGDHIQARQAFDRAVRNWKASPVLTASREDFLRSTWQEAKSLLAGSETSAARS